MVIIINFYQYNPCENVLIFINDLGCNGKDLQRVTPNSIGDYSYHIPLISKIGNEVVVKISLDKHPMEKEHYIMWICLQTNKGFYLKKLNPYDNPQATFYLSNDEEIVKAYDYCNIHRLWEERQ